MLILRRFNVPPDIGIARVEDKIKSILSIRIDRDIHHNALISDIGVARQMKEHRHVIGIISGIEARNIDQGLSSEAVSELAGIECWVAIVGEVAGYAILVGALDV